MGVRTVLQTFLGQSESNETEMKGKDISNNVLFAFDNSGSTGNSAYYWNKVSQILEEVAASSGSVKYLEWNSRSHVVTQASVKKSIRGLIGTGGTDPGVVADYIMKNNFRGHLVLLTDGQCQPDRANQIMGMDHQFSFVDVYLISAYRGSANMSVSSPFTRASPHTVRLITSGDSTPKTISITTQDMELANKLIDIGTYEEFLHNYDTLEKVITAKTMGLGSQTALRQQLLRLQKRLVREQAVRQTKDTKQTDDPLTAALKNGNQADALRAAKQIILAHDTEGLSDLQNKMSFLLRCTEGALQRTFSPDAIASERARFAPVAAVVPAEVAAPVIDTEIKLPEWTCPLTLESENKGNVCFLVRQGSPVLAGVDKKAVDAIINNPLILLIDSFTDIRRSLLSRIGHPISLEALQNGSDSCGGFPFETDPMDRNEVLPVAICLGAARDHAKATDTALRAIMSGGKVLGNVDLIFAVIAMSIENGEISWATQYQLMFQNQLLWRLKERKTFASLSGLPNTVNQMLPLGTACWFVHETALMSSQVIPGAEPIRMHMAYAEYIKSLVELAGYPIDENANQMYITALAVMLRLRRKVVTGEITIPVLRSMAKALYQATVKIDKKNIQERVLQLERFCQYIPVDGTCQSDVAKDVAAWVQNVTQIESATNLSVGLLHTLLETVNVNSSASDHRVNVEECPQLPSTLPDEWTWEDHPKELFQPSILSTTCRPEYNGGQWEADALAYYKTDNVRKIFPSTKYYMEFVVKYEQWPTFDEFALFTYHRLCVSENSQHETLPSNLRAWFDVNFAAHQSVRDVLTPSQASQRYRDSCKVEIRAQIEEKKEHMKR